MPVFLNPGRESWPGLNWPRVPPAAIKKTHRTSLHIGLVNNMADAALEATERQFLTLLDAAAGDVPVILTLYALPEVERNAEGQRRVESFYLGTDRLWALPPEQYPDGLIVTGREPLTPDLRDEAYWPSLTRLLAWTRMHARSTVWSCLAAHAAVLALDGIPRVRNPQKHFGVFSCEQIASNALLAGAPQTLRMPHSRWNGLSADQLAAKGYQVLTYNGASGVDTFVKQDAAWFVFFQGHPEYEPQTLLREYRRDVARYVNGGMETYPLLPANYFDADTERSLREIEAKARVSRQEKLLGEISAVLDIAQTDETWRDTSALIYRNWLNYLCTQKGFGIEDRIMPHGILAPAVAGADPRQPARSAIMTRRGDAPAALPTGASLAGKAVR